MGRHRTNGLGRCLHAYNPVFDTKTELSVRMRELNFGMSALSGSVVGADAAADVAGAIQQAPDALSLAWRSTQRPRFWFHRKI